MKRTTFAINEEIGRDFRIKLAEVSRQTGRTVYAREVLEHLVKEWMESPSAPATTNGAPQQ